MRLTRTNFFPFLYDAYACVKEFHTAFDQPVRKTWADSTHSGRLLRAALIKEEFNELLSASSQEDKLDAYCDLLYVVLGTMLDVGYSDQMLTSVNYNNIPDFTGQIPSIITNLEKSPCCFRRLSWGLPDAAAGVAKGGWTAFPKFDDAFKAVHKANMTKLWDHRPEDKALTIKEVGKLYLVKRSDGKVIKSPTFTKPDLSPFLS